jgi:trimeric autotransporter adhesin
MAISKNFVVKNGLEVAIDSLVVDTDTKRVGIASTTPNTTLDVRGGIGATHLEVTGIATIATLSVTGFTATNGDFTNLTGTIGTITSLESTNGSIDNLSGTIGTITSIESISGTITTLNSTNGTITNGTITNIIGTSSTIANIVGTSGTITNISGTNITGTSGTITNITGTNGTIANITGTAVSFTTSTVTNSTGTNLNITGIATLATADIASLTITGAAVTDLTVTNNFDVIGLSTLARAEVDFLTVNTNLDLTGIGTISTLYSDEIIATSSTITSLTGTSSSIANIVGTAATFTNLEVTGLTTTYNLSVENEFSVYDATATFYNNVNIIGNLSIGGTSSTLFAQSLKISDKDIVLGITTDAFGNDISTDDTANHGGIALASTEGSSLVDIRVVGVETLPPTYKKIMWFKSGSFVGLNTDAWLFNYGVGIGSTQIPDGVRLAVGSVHVTEDGIDATNATFTNSLTGTAGTITNFTGTNGNITNITGTSSTITNISGTAGTITTLNSTNGTVTNLTGTAGTITTLDSTNATLTNGTITNLSGTIGTVTTFSGTNLSGVIGTITTFESAYATLDELFVTGISTFQGNISIGDNDVLNIGIGSDLKIYHDASNSYIDESGTGNLYIRSTGGNIYLKQNTTEDGIIINQNGSVQIYYDNSLKLQTISAGATVTGNMYATTFYGDGSNLTGVVGSASTLQGVLNTGNSSTIGMNVTGLSTITDLRSTNLTVSGIATAQDFNSLSDVNYKTNVETIDGALDKVNNLRGVSFDWKESGQSSYGVIAQELEEILPELVQGTDPRTVNYNGLIGVLIEAVKELKAEVDKLKSKQV